MVALLLLLLSRFSRVWLCATPETAADQAPRSLGFSRQEHWSGLPSPSPGHESEKWKWSRSVVSNPQRGLNVYILSESASDLYWQFQWNIEYLYRSIPSLLNAVVIQTYTWSTVTSWSIFPTPCSVTSPPITLTACTLSHLMVSHIPLRISKFFIFAVGPSNESFFSVFVLSNPEFTFAIFWGSWGGEMGR